MPVRVAVMDDRVALVFLCNSNLQREEVNIVDEARMVQAMIDELGMAPEEVCRKLCRPMRWLEGRQMVFGFDDEVQDALRHEDPARRLSEGAYMEVLSAPEELRERAMQLVLFPSYQHEPLSEWMAHDLIYDELIPEWNSRREWEDGAEDLKRKVTAKLRKACLAKQPEVHVIVQGWDRDSRGIFLSRPALGGVDELLTEDAPHGLKWLDLAERMSAPVYVIPPSGDVVVSAKMIHDFEDSLVDFHRRKAAGEEVGKDGHVMLPWLARDGAKGKQLHLEEDGNLPMEDDKAEPVATPDGEDGVKIEQVMERSAMVDMGTVRKVALWAVMDDADPNDAPEFVPGWAKEMAFDGKWLVIDAVCEWVVRLNAKDEGPLEAK